MTLDEAYEIVTTEWSDVQANIPAIEQHVKDVDAKTVIELGVRSGVSTVVFLHALRESIGGAQGAKGPLYSVDVNYPAGTFAGLLSEIAGNNALGAWKFVHGDDLDPEVTSQLPDQADLVFIDTVHSFEHTGKELIRYSKHVRPGGRILLHDTELEYPETAPGDEPFPVKRAAQNFAFLMSLEFENDPAGYGLGCIYV